jgi:hypothetical protein
VCTLTTHPPTHPLPPPPHPADERACAYIAGAAPNRWGNFTAAQQQGRRAAPGCVTPPVKLEYGATPDQLAEAAEIRRGHPLYASISLGEFTRWQMAGAGGWGRMGACAARGAGVGCCHGRPHTIFTLLHLPTTHQEGQQALNNLRPCCLYCLVFHRLTLPCLASHCLHSTAALQVC